MRYFFAEKMVAVGETKTLRGSDARHIKKVLRLRPNDTIGLFDGSGAAYTARIEAFQSEGIVVEIVSSAPAAADSPVDIVIAQAFLKDKKMDDLARQLTELGTTKWIPFFSRRSVPRPDHKRLAGRMARWRKISREALKQCRRGRLMVIEPAGALPDVLKMARHSDVKVLFWENQPLPVNLRQVVTRGQAAKNIFAILGPEGGFSPAEVEAASQEGFITADLGPRILRAETATIAAAVLLQFMFGDLGKNT